MIESDRLVDVPVRPATLVESKLGTILAASKEFSLELAFVRAL
jgi:hypothetical protein